ncbi:primosomal replication protein [Photobacterium sp. 1_MG-2023]|uniref:primosomal replication protein n=1 Tax=Photobacterium sp. 1_MG-2023 TaxID=3062646 RepID=UPI0026E1D4B7|nr:primosomal replication protein [Photobacterium sp. 1_MG-2023]MDO6705059.1 primosomal replication protein [Photobacterium sp. 1_MG-2023]
MTKDLSRLSDLVAQLIPQAEALDHQRGESAKALFDHQLFHCRSHFVMPCIREIQQEIQAMQNEQASGRLHRDRAAYVCERILTQIQAIQREMATKQIREAEPKYQVRPQKSLHQLYDDLAQHQDWERRLAAMVKDKAFALEQVTLADQKQPLQQQLLALEGRLQRCQQAMAKIEQHIARRERKG